MKITKVERLYGQLQEQHLDKEKALNKVRTWEKLRIITSAERIQINHKILYKGK